LLTNGKVLFTGGVNGSTGPCIPANPELYDPLTGLFSLAGPYDTTGFPSDPCFGGTAGLTYAPATLLSDGKVLILSEPVAELYDPDTNTFRLATAIDEVGQIFGRTATLMTNGKVLAVGGNSDFPLSLAELYDPSAGKFTATESMHFTREEHTATLLPDGSVLITGGRTDNWFDAPPFAELYDPSAGVFSPITMKAGRSSHQATLLKDGRVLITGGQFTGPYSVTSAWVHASAEFYNPAVLIPAPSLLSLSGDGRGQGAIQHAGTDRIASASDPAVAGEYLAIYLTGLADRSVIPPQIAIGGRMAEITFFGNVPGYPGLNVINIRMPSGVAPGSTVPVRMTYLGRSSNEVTIGVQ
jgi:hypothetical protein